MAGYDWSAGKSNNAVAAELRGLVVASNLAAWVRRRGRRYAGCTAADVAAVLEAGEWHHTSKFFNRVKYYDRGQLAMAEVREALAARIARRKEYSRLVREHAKLGLDHCLTPDGQDEWFPISGRPDGGRLVDGTYLERLVASLALARARQAVPA